MNAKALEAQLRDEGTYNTEPYHLEKYVVPGAVAVSIIFFGPWYLLGGSALGGVDLGAALIGALVAGHVIESLKVYQWGRKVRENFRLFNAEVKGVLKADGIDETFLEKAKSMLFSRLSASERSEFSWNLVRWQKMTVFATLLCVGAIEWIVFGILLLLESKKWNPFAGGFEFVILKQTSSPLRSLVAEGILAAMMILGAWYIYKYAIGRQTRNNNFLLQLFLKHRGEIVDQLKQENAARKGENGKSQTPVK